MNEVTETGGARIGFAHATWPFAKLTANRNVLQLNGSIIGNLYFRPSDIISFESSSFISGSGIIINHRVKNYSSRVTFLTWGSSSDLIRKIESTGFLQNSDAVPAEIEAQITSYQSRGQFPIKWSAAIAFVIIWNLLFLFEDIGYNGAPLPFLFAFSFALALLLFEPFRYLILKKGRTIKDVKTFLLFLMLITGLMFLILSFT